MAKQLPSLNELEAYREWLKTRNIGKTHQYNLYHATKAVLNSDVECEDDVNWIFKGKGETWRKFLRKGFRYWGDFQRTLELSPQHDVLECPVLLLHTDGETDVAGRVSACD